MPRRTKKTDAPIVTALKFVSIAQSEIGEPYKTHCRFMNNEVVAFDGILAAGCPADEVEANVCPHTFRLIDALEKTDGAYSLSILDTNQIAIKTDNFKANVPCIPWDELQYVGPDPNAYALTNAFRTAGEAAMTFSAEGATTIAYSAALTRHGSLVGTNGNVIIEAWHGSPFPPGLIIPKAFFAALGKITKNIVGFGYVDHGSSLTIWFEDKSWLRTQLYINETFPQIDPIFKQMDEAKPTTIPKGLFDAIRAVASFNSERRVVFTNEGVQSHKDDKIGAQHLVRNVFAEIGSFNSKNILGIEPFAEKIDFLSNEKLVTFVGKHGDNVKIRGALAKSHS